MTKAKKFIYAKPFNGLPKITNFSLKEEDLRPIRDGEILAEALYISIDPYVRVFLPMLPIGSDVFSGQIARYVLLKYFQPNYYSYNFSGIEFLNRVVASRDPEYSEGSIIYGDFGWRTHTIVNPKV